MPLFPANDWPPLSARALEALKRAIWQRVSRRIEAPEELRVLQQEPVEKAVKDRVWQRVQSQITVPVADAALSGASVQASAPTAAMQRVFRTVSQRLQPISPFTIAFTRMKWVSAFAVVALLVQMSPALLVATPTVADAKVLLLPAQSTVFIGSSGLWQPVTSELELKPGMRIRTEKGGARIVYRDDAVLRLDDNTQVTIHDTSEHIEAAPELLPTFTLHSGRAWLQGLLPQNVRGMTLAFASSSITVHEGSVSARVQEDGFSSVTVWDRRARLHTASEQHRLTVSQTATVVDGTADISKLSSRAFSEDWPKKNLQMDAVHQQYIAHLQQERRAAQAGILPTSSLYGVKRAAEEWKVYLSSLGEERTQELLNLADVRLNEAAALMVSGSSEQDIEAALERYRVTMQALASGSGDTVSQFLIRQNVSSTIANVSAALPSDNGYKLKKVVFEASAILPPDVIDADSLQAALFTDTLDSLTASVEDGHAADIEETWNDLQPYLALIDGQDASVPEDIAEQTRAILGDLAASVRDQLEDDVLPQDVSADILAYLPEELVTGYTITPLTTEEIAAIADSMRERVYTFKMTRSRDNQLRTELMSIQDHPERGRILRSLHRSLPERSHLRDMVQRKIVDLQREKEAEAVVRGVPGGSGGSL